MVGRAVNEPGAVPAPGRKPLEMWLVRNGGSFGNTALSRVGEDMCSQTGSRCKSPGERTEASPSECAWSKGAGTEKLGPA